jgi:hypothetical protein
MAQSLNAKYMQINANKETRMLQPLQLNTPTIIIIIITVQIWYLIKISTTVSYLETVFIIFLRASLPRSVLTTQFLQYLDWTHCVQELPSKHVFEENVGRTER